ncbi:MAG: phosphoglycerate kinase [bacterium]|nr:phosphoglycerate kinase [bacterium]
MGIKTIDDVDLSGKTVLVRCDLNVPLGKDDKGRVIVADDSRIEASLPTLGKLLDQGCKVGVCSHLGRPEGERKPELSLRPVGAVLENKMGVKVHFADDCIGTAVTAYLHKTKPGEICLLENLRFYQQERDNDPDFAARLAAPFDAYVNDAFGTCHRKNASMVATVEYLSPAVAGYLVDREIGMLDRLFNDPPRPFVMVIGGVKLSTKLGFIRSMLERVDTMIVGGALAFTFLKAQGFSVGNSPVKEIFLDDADGLIQRYNGKLILPEDWVISPQTDSDINRAYSGDANVPDGFYGVDIGSKTMERFTDMIAGAGSVFWNGPVGVFETPGFEGGTRAVAQAIVDCEGVSIVGGGDSVYALRKLGFGLDNFGFISTGGGATLRYLQDGTLEALRMLDVAGE